MRWETAVTSEFFGRKIKLLIVSARPSEEREQRAGAARSISAVKATLGRDSPPRSEQGHPGGAGGAGAAGKATKKRSRSGKVTKWRALIYYRSLCSFPATETLSERSGMRSWGRGLGSAASRGSSRARPSLPSGLRQRHPTAPLQEAATARKGRGRAGEAPGKK